MSKCSKVEDQKWTFYKMSLSFLNVYVFEFFYTSILISKLLMWARCYQILPACHRSFSIWTHENDVAKYIF